MVVVPLSYGVRWRRRCARSSRNIPATAQRIHAAGVAITMAMPAMAMGTESLRAPSMVMAAPAAATNAPTQSGLTFQCMFTLSYDVRIAAGWAIRRKRPEPSCWMGVFLPCCSRRLFRPIPASCCLPGGAWWLRWP